MRTVTDRMMNLTVAFRHFAKVPNKIKETGNVRIHATLRWFREIFFAVDEKRSVTYSHCVSVALVSQHSKCVYHVIFSYVACLTTVFFHILM